MLINMLSEKRYNSFTKDRLAKTEIGKFILCEAREDNVTRLFIHQFSSLSSVLTKDGWWDTFTLTEIPCKKGFYLCSIQDFRIDRNDFLNCIVYPSKYLGDSINEDLIGWDYLFYCGKLSREYISKHYRVRFNIDNLYKMYKIEFENSGYRDIDSFLFAEFIFDKITIEDISVALEEKYDIEKLAEEINNNIHKHSEKYPLLIKKLPKENVLGYNMYTVRNTSHYLVIKSSDYNRLKLGKESDILVRVEAVLQHWDRINKERKQKEKEKKKLLRQSKKNNKKEEQQ